MKFRALVSTADGRLTKGRIYEGKLAYCTVKRRQVARTSVVDNTGRAMTFNPDVFEPVP